MLVLPPHPPLFPYTTLFRSRDRSSRRWGRRAPGRCRPRRASRRAPLRSRPLPEGVEIEGVRGGWRDEDGSVRVLFYPNGGTTGLEIGRASCRERAAGVEVGRALIKEDDDETRRK